MPVRPHRLLAQYHVALRLCVAVLFVIATAAAEESADVILELRDSKSPPRMPQLELPLVWKPTPRDARSSFELTEAARYGEARVGDRTLRLLFLERQGTGIPGFLHSDHGTGKFDPKSEPVRGRASTGKDKLSITFEGVDGGGFKHRVQLVYVPGRVVARVVLDRHRLGRLRIGGAERGLFLFDADGDGRFDGRKDRWVLLRMDRNRRLNGTRLWSDTFLLGEPYIPFRVDGTTYMVEDVSAAGDRARVRIGVPTIPMTRVLDRRYAEVEARYKEIFDAEEERFIKSWKFDKRRAKIEHARAWNSRMSLDEAKTAAKEAGKPLLVHYYTESTIWSYRYERYTFRDKKIDALLDKFLLVKIDAGKDLVRSYETVGVGRWPALVPLTPKGHTVRFPLFVRNEKGETAELDSEIAIVGWQRPRELEINLKRVLDAME